jgi:hypothetical protein
LAQLPAFPGADGAARNVTGGRGGIVYHVTKIDSAIDDPERNDFGTLRYGLNSANFPANTPRTIVFDVGGVFNLGRLPQPANGWDPNGNGWDAQSRLTIGGSNVTLAGQTAPGAGVIFMGGGLKPQGNNNIIRNVTVASGYGLQGWWSPGNPMRAAPGTPAAGTDASQWFPDNTVYDGMDIAGTNLMIDHVSTLFATDETISMNEVANNITVQYSNISQGLNYPQWDAEGGGLTGHALGSLLSAGSTGFQASISFHHNLYAHQKGRVPQLGTISGSQGAYYDFRNNVFYNWFGTAGSKSGTTWMNLVNNFYLAGPGGDNPAGGTNPAINQSAGGTGVLAASATIFRSGNLLDSNKDGDANDGAALAAGGAAAALWQGGVPTYAGATDSAAAAYDRVLNYMGANWWNRDGVIDSADERIINEARTGTGKVIAWADDPWNADPNEGVEWRALLNTPTTYRPANFDTDQDGMPDGWELSLGLNPLAANNNADFDTDGYTDLEEYLNELAAWPAPRPLAWTGGDARYAIQSNWDLNWQPSRYDTVQINSGTATIDAVGQAAGAVQIGAAGTLRLASGANLTQRFNSITSSGKLDVTNNALIIDYATSSPLASIAAQIVSARNGGNWNGNGITSSQANASEFALGYGEATTVLGIAAGDIGLFRGQVVDGTSVLVLFTRLGDATLDRAVNLNDFTALAARFGTAGTWAHGDFNYDSQVNLDDFTILAANFGQTMPAQLSRGAVPEPAMLVAMALIAITGSMRFRRSSHS